MPVIKDEHYLNCDFCNYRGSILGGEGYCGECQGTGEIDFDSDYNSYEVVCKSCKGHGVRDPRIVGDMDTCPTCKGSKKHLKNVPVLKVAEGRGLSGEYVQLFEDLPKIKLSWHEQHELFVFKFTGGFGLIMPMYNLQT